jgi:hypothetical protein
MFIHFRTGTVATLRGHGNEYLDFAKGGEFVE